MESGLTPTEALFLLHVWDLRYEASLPTIGQRMDRSSSRIRAELFNTNSPSGRAWVAGHPSQQGWRRQKGLANSRRHAFYYDMMRDMLIANFNPSNKRSTEYRT